VEQRVGTLVPEAVELVAADGRQLAAHYWPAATGKGVARAVAVINPATAVKAAYYHRFAAFLAAHGYAALTYDYRGIGASRRGSLRSEKGTAKLDWGRHDCDAALAWAARCHPRLPLHVVAHSIGGLLVGLAPHNRHVARCLTVGAQYAYWRDYVADRRLSMWLRWHLLMPLVTALWGYFPARRLGWHEDLPAAAAYEWAFRSARLEHAYRRQQRGGADPLAAFSGLRGDILALTFSDDPFATPAALDRLLDYCASARRVRVQLDPADLGVSGVGHFAFFHERFRDSLWQIALRWLESGVIPAGNRRDWPAPAATKENRRVTSAD
jgi:predicted alpha/beta hydrolase